MRRMLTGFITILSLSAIAESSIDNDCGISFSDITKKAQADIFICEGSVKAQRFGEYRAVFAYSIPQNQDFILENPSFKNNSSISKVKVSDITFVATSKNLLNPGLAYCFSNDYGDSQSSENYRPSKWSMPSEFGLKIKTLFGNTLISVDGLKGVAYGQVSQIGEEVEIPVKCRILKSNH